MKRLLFMVACCATLIVGCSEAKKSVAEDENKTIAFTMNFNGCNDINEGDNVELFSRELNEVVATVVVDDTKHLDAEFTHVYGDCIVVKVNGEAQTCVLVEDDNVAMTYNAEKSDYDVTGTSFYGKDKEYAERGEELINTLYSSKSEEEAEANYQAFLSFLEESVRGNLDNPMSLTALSTYMSFGGDSKKGEELFKSIDKHLSHLKVYKAMLNTMPGADIIDLNLPDVNGEMVSCKELCKSGKWVLIDFWATWCGPCRGEIPHLVKAYENFAPKGLEIYGVSFDRKGSEDRWKQFIADNNMTWINVWGTAENGSWEVAKPLNVDSIPSNFLYSPEGKLVAKNLRGEDIEKILAEHIK